jgi:ribosomal protein S3
MNKKKIFLKSEKGISSVRSTKFESLNSIKGIKFSIKGKIKGKLRAKSYNLLIGSSPKNNKNTKVEYYKMHSYTVYGKFGLKFWVHRI